MLQPGTKLGPYEILAQLGAGGMGEVYKARDTRLDRFVAVKILPAHLADSPELRERFEREARTIAKLNHPHICTLHDIGRHELVSEPRASASGQSEPRPQGETPYGWRFGGSAPQTEPPHTVDYLVLEYLEGETLSARLKKGPLPLEQVLRYAVEVSDALDKAHRAGVTHRDIKPGNIMLVPTTGGAAGGSHGTSSVPWASSGSSPARTKLLDFGLAKLKQEIARATTPASDMPTVAGELTEHGTLLGTLHYMAPEQVEGKVNEIDARSDIFAFGALVYEMATGKKAFPGDTQASVIAKILEVDPPPMSKLQPMTPPVLDRVVKRCLAKDAEDRWQTMRDLCHELQWITEGGRQADIPAPLPTRRSLRERVAWATAAISILIAVLSLLLPVFRRAPAAAPIRFTIPPPEGVAFFDFPSHLTISPDGSKLAIQAVDSAGRTQLWIRSLASLEAHPLSGTENPVQQFWSPDSRFLAFFADGKLKKIAITGGPSQVLAEHATGGTARGTGTAGNGTWSRDGIILFGSGALGTIQRISETGGPATPVTTLDASRQENAHIWPHFLPDGRRFLYFAQSTNPENNAVYVASLDSNERKLLLNAASNVAYTTPGYLLYHTQGTLMAHPFDADRAEPTGEPIPIAEGLLYNTQSGKAAFAASENGALVYRGGGDVSQQFTWVARDGKNLGTVGEPGRFTNFALSPDERRVAVERIDLRGGTDAIWLLELSRGIFTRFTFDSVAYGNPIWSPDGQQIAFNARKNGKPGIFRKMVNGSGEEELLFESDDPKFPEDWTPDGQFIVYGWPSPEMKFALLPHSGDRQPRPLLETPFRKDEPHVSPDGRWLAYFSEESGKPEIYIQPFQGVGEKLRISPNGGGQPRWRKDGSELFYLALDGTMMSVPIQAGATLEPGVPQELFQTRLNMAPNIDQYAVTADGQRFLLNLPLADQAAAPITVVLNWTAALKR